MGWLHPKDERCDHEGFTVAYVPRDWIAKSSASELSSGRPVATVNVDQPRNGPWRELGVRPRDREHVIRGFIYVGAACICGWRSSRVGVFDSRVEWFPCTVETPKPLDYHLHELWQAHAEDVFVAD